MSSLHVEHNVPLHSSGSFKSSGINSYLIMEMEKKTAYNAEFILSRFLVDDGLQVQFLSCSLREQPSGVLLI